MGRLSSNLRRVHDSELLPLVRDDGVISSEVMRRVERDLDLDETRLVI